MFGFFKKQNVNYRDNATARLKFIKLAFNIVTGFNQVDRLKRLEKTYGDDIRYAHASAYIHREIRCQRTRIEKVDAALCRRYGWTPIAKLDLV